MLLKSKAVLCAGLFLCISGPALAEGNWTAGAFVYSDNGLYAGSDGKALATPYLAYDTERLHISPADGLVYRAFQSEVVSQGSLSLSVLLAPRYEPSLRNLDVFDGIKRDIALEAGLRARFEYQFLFAEFEALADVSQVHSGKEVALNMGAMYQSGRLGLEAAIGATYRDAKLNNHMFGVTASEATATRAEFTASDSISPFISLAASYAITDRVTAVGEILFQDIKDMADSPLTDKQKSVGLGLGLMYSF